MRVLDASRRLYEERGRAMLHSRFPEYEGRIAVGLAGHGSECFGFDDALSLDHDCAAGFCMWLEDGDYGRIAPELRRAYAALPPGEPSKRSAVAPESTGALRTGDFFRRYTGSPGAPESLRQWLSIPEYALAEAVNGEVWSDGLGRFTAIRSAICDMPEDVRKKKLAARAILMAQSGQYNYPRCLKRGANGAAMLAAAEFVRAAGSMIYLLNRRYAPYYKWLLRGMEELPLLSDMAPALEYILCAENGGDGSATKLGVTEDICAAVIKELRRQGLTDGSWTYLEPHAFEISERISDPEIRSLHIMEG